MATKIDLLPGYVGMRRWFKRVLIICVAVLAVVASILSLLFFRDKQRLAKLQEDVNNIEHFAQQTEAAQRERDAATQEAAPIKASVDFMADASKTGPERAALLDLIRRYIYEGAVVSSIDLSDGQNARFTVTVRTPDDYARFLTNLRRGSAQKEGPLFEGLPTGSGIPGFPDNRPIPPPQSISYTPQPIVFPLRINAAGKLRNEVRVPVEPGAAAAAPGAPGEPPPGMSGEPTSSAPPPTSP
jgi:type II secretory pathway pseudopilin PulG